MGGYPENEGSTSRYPARDAEILNQLRELIKVLPYPSTKKLIKSRIKIE
jgi:hypothetical protein